ncbi:MAG: (2Fe-2S)-binding protein [Deltaproteobacteria bacterium]|nr:(2Fe-2S)-binding protein [Deltaproteobacteria bacterium]
MKAQRTARPAADPIICCCNGVALSQIHRAMRNGARTLADLFDVTFAGCGPCGGNCQPELCRILATADRVASRRSAG